MTLDVILRRIGSADIPSFAILAKQIFTTTYGPAIPAGALADYLDRAFSVEALTAELADAAAVFQGAWHGPDLTGFSKLSPAHRPEGLAPGSAIELSKLYVAEAYQGTGVATALMSAALTEAARGGHGLMWLYVWEQNPRALAFYRKWGFEQVGKEDLQAAGVVFHDLILQRGLL